MQKPSARGNIYHSARDTWLMLVIWAAVLLMSLSAGALVFAHGRPDVSRYATAFAIACGAALALWFMYGTEYELGGEHLLIRSGPFRWKIRIAGIEAVEPSRSILSSPAFSLDRLAIRFDGGKTILISPQHREEFIRELQSRAPVLQDRKW